MERSKKTGELVKKIWSLEDYKPVNLKKKSISISYDQQSELFDTSTYSRKAISVYSGSCFEKIAGAIFGGFHHGGRLTVVGNGDSTIQPDISDHKRRRYIEVKSRAQNQQPKFLREQIIKNLSWMLYDFSEPRPKSYMALFNHNVLGMEKRNLKKQEYLEELTRGGILYGLFIPITISSQFFINPDKTQESGYLLREYNFDSSMSQRGYSSYHVVTFSSSFPRDLILEPEQTLEKIGFNPEDFKISRKKVKGLRINGKQVHQFPMLFMDGDLDYWINENRERIEEQIEEKTSEDITLPEFYDEDSLFGDAKEFAPTKEQLSEIEPIPFDIPPEDDIDEDEEEIPF